MTCCGERGSLLAITVGAEEDLEDGDGGVLQRGANGESLGLSVCEDIHCRGSLLFRRSQV